MPAGIEHDSVLYDIWMCSGSIGQLRGDIENNIVTWVAEGREKLHYPAYDTEEAESTLTSLLSRGYVAWMGI
jgi:hypothetical protein